MGFNIRMAVIFAAAAVLVALVSGFIGHVPFGYILIRSFIGGVIFAVIGFAAAALIARFLPEILELPDEDGNSFDISVGSDEEDDEIRRSAYSPHETDSGANDTDSDKKNDASVEIAGAKTDFSPGIDADLVEEVHEQRVDEESFSKGKTGGSESGDVSTDETESDMVDTLPDMDGMTDAFITAESPIEDIIDEGGSGNGNTDAQQAKEIAQAIRTVLHRDDQG